MPAGVSCDAAEGRLTGRPKDASCARHERPVWSFARPPLRSALPETSARARLDQIRAAVVSAVWAGTGQVRPITSVFTDDGLVPNNPLPFIYYRGAIACVVDPESTVKAMFASNDSGDMWRNGVYDYLHYHSMIHEAMGVARGRASCASAATTANRSKSRPAMRRSCLPERVIRASGPAAISGSLAPIRKPAHTISCARPKRRMRVRCRRSQGADAEDRSGFWPWRTGGPALGRTHLTSGRRRWKILNLPEDSIPWPGPGTSPACASGSTCMICMIRST